MKKSGIITLSSFIVPDIGKVCGFMTTYQGEVYEIGVDGKGETHFWLSGRKEAKPREMFLTKNPSKVFTSLIRRFNLLKKDCQEYALTGNNDLWWKIFNASADAEERITANKYPKGFRKVV